MGRFGDGNGGEAEAASSRRGGGENGRRFGGLSGGERVNAVWFGGFGGCFGWWNHFLGDEGRKKKSRIWKWEWV